MGFISMITRSLIVQCKANGSERTLPFGYRAIIAGIRTRMGLVAIPQERIESLGKSDARLGI